MPAAKKPFFSFNRFSEANCGRLYKNNYVSRLNGLLAKSVFV